MMWLRPACRPLRPISASRQQMIARRFLVGKSGRGIGGLLDLLGSCCCWRLNNEGRERSLYGCLSGTNWKGAAAMQNIANGWISSDQLTNCSSGFWCRFAVVDADGVRSKCGCL